MHPRYKRIRQKKVAGSGNIGTELPVDYLQMVRGVLLKNFAPALKEVEQIKAKPDFEVGGRIFPDEIVLYASLATEGSVGATTVWASADFDSKSTKVGAELILASCLDAVGAVLEMFFTVKDRNKLEQFVGDSLGAIENAPFVWSPVEIERQQVHVKIDKVNPKLDALADEFLAKAESDSKKKLH